MKSTTCFSKKTNEALSVYETEAEAQQSANYQRYENGRSLYLTIVSVVAYGT